MRPASHRETAFSRPRLRDWTADDGVGQDRRQRPSSPQSIPRRRPSSRSAAHACRQLGRAGLLPRRRCRLLNGEFDSPSSPSWSSTSSPITPPGAVAGDGACRTGRRPRRSVLLGRRGDAAPPLALGRRTRRSRPNDAGKIDDGRRVGYESPDELGELWRSRGLRRRIDRRAVGAAPTTTSFDDLFQPFTAGTGHSGACYASLDHDGRRRLRDRDAHVGSATPDGRVHAQRASVVGERNGRGAHLIGCSPR